MVAVAVAAVAVFADTSGDHPFRKWEEAFLSPVEVAFDCNVAVYFEDLYDASILLPHQERPQEVVEKGGLRCLNKVSFVRVRGTTPWIPRPRIRSSLRLSCSREVRPP